MFVIVEGPNGSGKTSLIKSLGENGYKTLSSPNGTALAHFLRPACRGVVPWKDLDKRIQMLLFSAARLDEYLKLVHNENNLIVADRWWTSTYVYQCILQGLSIPLLELTKHPEEKIDMVFLLDADNETLLKRVKDERSKNPDHGVCKWTEDIETMTRAMDIYRKDLPEYLSEQGINYNVLDTTCISREDVYNIFVRNFGNKGLQ